MSRTRSAQEREISAVRVARARTANDRDRGLLRRRRGCSSCGTWALAVPRVTAEERPLGAPLLMAGDDGLCCATFALCKPRSRWWLSGLLAGWLVGSSEVWQAGGGGTGPTAGLLTCIQIVPHTLSYSQAVKPLGMVYLAPASYNCTGPTHIKVFPLVT